jgi:ketosteroid isomerase-like protein
MIGIKPTAIGAAGLALLAGCSNRTAPMVAAVADAAAIGADTAAWVVAYNAGDTGKVVDYYADDAVLMPPDHALITEHEAVRQYYVADMAAFKAAGLSFALDQETSGASGELGWHSGTFRVRDAGGAVVGTGKDTEIWRKSGGKWRMIRDIWSNDPAPAAATAPAAQGSR